MSEAIKSSAHGNEGNGKWDMVSKFLGPIDLHYHFRSRPLLKFFEKNDRYRTARVLEFGCGGGANLFALQELMPDMVGVGIDIDPDSIDMAKKLALAKGFKNLDFISAGSLDALKIDNASFDYILLIDVLEHLDNPRALLDNIEKLLKPSGIILISVPTHRYPRVFGRKFHNEVGHVRDGFTLPELDQLLGSSFVRTESSYNTGLIASLACASFYRGIPKVTSRKLAILGMIGLHIARLADVFNGKSLSCSLWAVYRKRV